MKKVLLVLAVASVMVSCGGKKKGGDDKKPADTTANANNNTNSNTGDNSSTPTAPNANVPTFSDPEVQKFVNDYTALVLDYKNHMTDPARAQEWAKSSQEWSGKMMNIGMKLANNPDDLKKWTDWGKWLNEQLVPATK